MNTLQKTKREIQCLERLHELTAAYEEFLQFLLQELLITRDELKAIHKAPELDRAKLIQEKLATLSKERKLQLLEYEWTILPFERIHITIVTDNGHREFNAEV